jgi:peptidoglycan/LPS O-acetylase OafA/YrhL
LYPLALKTYANGIAYVFADFATGACCFLEIVGVAGLIGLFNRPAKLFVLIGTYSYGLYLIHQPYVIWLGLHIRPQPIGVFLLIFVATLAVLSGWGTLLERNTNRVIDKIVRREVRS